MRIRYFNNPRLAAFYAKAKDRLVLKQFGNVAVQLVQITTTRKGESITEYVVATKSGSFLDLGSLEAASKQYEALCKIYS